MRPVTIRGQEFRSRGAAAEHFGLSRAAISKAAKRGALDLLGLGIVSGIIPGSPEDHARDAADFLALSMMKDGRSASAAAKAVGRPQPEISKAWAARRNR
jgi:DNA-binding transcriptional LysR family regulator